MRMPPRKSGPRLKPEEVEVLRRWIASGALGMGVSTISGGPLRHLLIDLDADEAPPAQALLAMITNVGLLLGSALFGSLSSELGTRAERVAGMYDAVIGVTVAFFPVVINTLAGLSAIDAVTGGFLPWAPVITSGTSPSVDHVQATASAVVIAGNP